MKLKYCLSTLFLVITLALQAQQFKVSGTVTDALSGKALPGIAVEMGIARTLTGSDGTFNLYLSNGEYTLTISGNGYETASISAKVASADLETGIVSLQPAQQNAESGITEITLTSDNDDQDQVVSSILHSGQDPFVNAASYAFSGMFFRMRGYDQELQNVFMDGIPVNDPETGRAVWSEWGGLNDVVRNRQYINGLEPAQFSIGNLGGSTFINTRASMQRKQTKVSYSLSNRTYSNRLMLTYSTGLMDNGWAFTVSGSRRWSQEGYVPGTFYDAYAWFAGAEKKLNAKHSIALTAYGSPFKRGQMGPSVQEAYDLAGTNYYNPNWGYQNGEVRNARVRSSHEPMFILNHYWTINERAKLTTSVGYTFGKTGTTGLNWYNSADPRPDYYRYLPSYQTDPLIASMVKENWENDESVRQINWDKLYQANYLANFEGKQSRYIVENNVSQQNQAYVNTRLNMRTGKHGMLSAGAGYTHYKGSHYKELSDLLGGKYWIDIDQFSERDFKGDTAKLQNDMKNPNKVVKEGDRFGYDYDLVQNKISAWVLEQWAYSHFDYYLGGAANYVNFYRDGKMQNGRQPETSYGKSEVKSNFIYDLKAGATWKITGRHYVSLNGARLMREPLLRDAYISSRNGSKETPGIDVSTIYAGDLSYVVRYPGISARVTVFQNWFENFSEINRFYHDDYKTYVNMVMSGQNRVHQGLEAGLLAKVTSWMSVSAAGSFGNYRYTNRPLGTISFDNGSLPDTTETIYIKNFYVPGTPQVALNGALKFNKNYWFFDVNLNYYDQIWLDFNPERRTIAAITNIGPGSPLIELITKQEKLTSGYTLDASIGKSIRYKGNFIMLNFSVSNLLNNQELKSGGFEQLRFDFTDKNVSKFPPKYFYSFGRTYFLNVGFRF